MTISECPHLGQCGFLDLSTLDVADDNRDLAVRVRGQLRQHRRQVCALEPQRGDRVAEIPQYHSLILQPLTLLRNALRLRGQVLFPNRVRRNLARCLEVAQCIPRLEKLSVGAVQPLLDELLVQACALPDLFGSIVSQCLTPSVEDVYHQEGVMVDHCDVHDVGVEPRCGGENDLPGRLAVGQYGQVERTRLFVRKPHDREAELIRNQAGAGWRFTDQDVVGSPNESGVRTVRVVDQAVWLVVGHVCRHPDVSDDQGARILDGHPREPHSKGVDDRSPDGGRAENLDLRFYRVYEEVESTHAGDVYKAPRPLLRVVDLQRDGGGIRGPRLRGLEYRRGGRHGENHQHQP